MNGRWLALAGVASTCAVLLPGCRGNGVTVRQTTRFLVTNTDSGEAVPNARVDAVQESLLDGPPFSHLTVRELADEQPHLVASGHTDENGVVDLTVSETYSCGMHCDEFRPRSVVAGEWYLLLIRADDQEETIELRIKQEAIAAGESFTVEVLSVGSPTRSAPSPLF